MRTDTVVEDAGFHLSWGAIFGGAFVTLGTWILLHTLGLAAGLTAIDTRDPGSLRAVGIGTGVWSILVPLLSLFVGGFVAARTAGLINRGTGAIHGAVMWGLTTVFGAILVSAAIASTLSAGLRLGAKAVGAGAGAVAGADVEGGLGLNLDDVLGPANQRLRAQGLPPVTAQQIEQATRDVVQQGVREGRLDQEMITEAIAANTALTRGEAEQIAGRIEAAVTEKLSQLREGAQGTAAAAAEAAGKAFWVIFFGLLLGLVSAVAGALVGTSRRQRLGAELAVEPEVIEERAAGEPVVTRPVVPEPTRP
jgi:hypothetical protein